MEKRRLCVAILILSISFSLPQLAYSGDAYEILTDPNKPNRVAAGICSLSMDGSRVAVKLNAVQLRRGHAYTVWGNFNDGSGAFHLDGNIAGGRAHEFSGQAELMGGEIEISLTLSSHGKVLNSAQAILDQITMSPGVDPGCNGPNAPRKCETVGTCTLEYHKTQGADWNEQVLDTVERANAIAGPLPTQLSHPGDDPPGGDPNCTNPAQKCGIIATCKVSITPVP